MNVVNRRLDGPPTQGRARECARRLRQLERRQERAKTERMVAVLAEMPPEELAALSRLGPAEVAYLEEQVDMADALVEMAPAGEEPMAYARAVLKALERP